MNRRTCVKFVLLKIPPSISPRCVFSPSPFHSLVNNLRISIYFSSVNGRAEQKGGVGRCPPEMQQQKFIAWKLDTKMKIDKTCSPLVLLICEAGDGGPLGIC